MSEGPEPPTGGTVAGSPLSRVIGFDVFGTIATTDHVDAGPRIDLPPKHSQNVKRVTQPKPLPSSLRSERGEEGEGTHPIQTLK